MKRNILLVTNVFPPAIGGPAVFGARLGEALANMGNRVTVLCATEESGDRTEYPFHVVRAGTAGNVIRRQLDIRSKLLWSAARASLIYCMGLEHQTAWACGVLRKPYVLRIGGDYVWEAARNKGGTDKEIEEYYKAGSTAERSIVSIEERRRKEEVAGAGGVIYVSEYMKMLARLWDDRRPDKEHIVYNGIACADTGSVQKRMPGEPLRLLFVGRQTNWKGVDAALLAISKLPGVTLTVSGSGPSLPGNVDLAKRLGVAGRVKFTGNVDSRDIGSVMREHHALILPSLYEGLSNTLLEAGVAGLACIASDRGGNPEVIEDGKTGILVDPYDINDIAGAIKSLDADEDKRVALADNHRKNVADKFTMDRAVSQTIGILESAI